MGFLSQTFCVSYLCTPILCSIHPSNFFLTSFPFADQIHVCPHGPVCPPPLCGPGIKVHQCHGNYRTCDSSEGCDLHRCSVGDDGCYFSCEQGSCSRTFGCDDNGVDCSTTYTYDTCQDPKCNKISLTGQSGGGGSGSSSTSDSISGSSSGSDSDSTVSAANATSTNYLTQGNHWLTVLSYVAAALVASMVIASVLLHRVSLMTNLKFICD